MHVSSTRLLLLLAHMQLVGAPARRTSTLDHTCVLMTASPSLPAPLADPNQWNQMSGNGLGLGQPTDTDPVRVYPPGVCGDPYQTVNPSTTPSVLSTAFSSQRAYDCTGGACAMLHQQMPCAPRHRPGTCAHVLALGACLPAMPLTNKPPARRRSSSHSRSTSTSSNTKSSSRRLDADGLCVLGASSAPARLHRWLSRHSA